MSIDDKLSNALFDYCIAWRDRASAVQDRVEAELRAAIEQHVAEEVAREREECAKACEDVATTRWDEYAASYNSAVFDCAAAIRARAEKETK